jgi:hypothetical protein
MEAVYRAYGLDTGLLTPDDFAWMNRFGRWASTPHLRSWWPWLAPLHSQGFADFLHKWFKLDRPQDLTGAVRPLADDDGGYTVLRWKAAFKSVSAAPACGTSGLRLQDLPDGSSPSDNMSAKPPRRTPSCTPDRRVMSDSPS